MLIDKGKKRQDFVSHLDVLPTELLIQLFSLAAGKEDGALNVRTLVSLTHVCSKWREVLTGTPTLWSTIDFSLPRLMDLCFDRARDVPLVLQGRIFRSTEVDFPSIILDHVPHTRSLSISFDSGVFEQLVPVLEVPPAPLLEVLDLRVGAAIPENLFQGSIPCLRKLTLTACEVPWTSFFNQRHSLTSLNLAGITRPSYNNLIRALGQAPQLVFLRMSYSLPPRAHSETPIPTLFMHNLRDLQLIDSKLAITSLHDLLFYHRNVGLDISCDSWDDDLTSLLGVFTHFVTPSDPVRSVWLDHSPTEIALYGTDQDLGDIPSVRWKGSPFLSTIRSHIDGNWSSSAKSIGTFCDRLLTTQVITLRCSASASTDLIWPQILGQFPGLRHLVLDHFLIPSFIEFALMDGPNAIHLWLDVLRIHENPACTEDGLSAFCQLVNFLPSIMDSRIVIRTLVIELLNTGTADVLIKQAALATCKAVVKNNELVVTW
ncbi:hypothetical protein ONZ45_g5098 [Pleurotus djamor]|nr:hypothetical protein ONZ45_g5098 [Pleurotus djamor]